MRMSTYIFNVFQNLAMLIFAIGFLASSCHTTPVETSIYDIQKTAMADSAMVVTAHPLASQVGTDILKSGGNAVDAAIAVQFALAVVYPRAGNIGGGGFMMVRTGKGEMAALDFREKAPAAAHPDMYLDSLGNVIDNISRVGHLSVGVPGTVDGMIKAHERYGAIKNFKDLVAPAVKFAEEGFRVTQDEADRLNDYKKYFIENFISDNKEDIYKYYPMVKEELWEKGDTLVQKDLAETLKRIQEKGEAGFYEGKTADLLVAEMQKGHGIITHEDLKNYNAVWRDPIVGEYKNYKIISMPPPSSGGVCLMQILEAIEDYPINNYGFHSPAAVHLMVEAERRAYADRAKHLGDSDFYPVPLERLLNPDYIRQRMADYNPEQATQSDSILAGDFSLMPESFETTHFSVVDKDGNAVSVTTTLNLNYGSKVITAGAGFFLNDEMDDFSAKPGVPNYFGLVGAEANKIEPNKRMLSSMTPTIVEKDGKLFMVLGSPGGSTIITTVAQVFLNVAEFGMSLSDAVNAKRFHHQWLPNTIMTEGETLPDTMALKKMGHKLDPIDRLGLVKAILVQDDGKLVGAGDPRHEDDDVEGY